MTRDVSTRVRGDVDRGSASTSVGEPTRRREADIHRIPFPAGVFRGGHDKKSTRAPGNGAARRESPERRGPIAARSHLPSWSGTCFPPRRPSGRRGASPPTLRTGFGSRVAFISRVTGDRYPVARVVETSSAQIERARVAPATRDRPESGVSTLDAFVLRRGKRPANRICLVNSPPSAPASVSPAAFGADTPPANIIFFATVCPYDPFRVEVPARRALIDAAANSIGRGTGTKSLRVGRFPPSLCRGGRSVSRSGVRWRDLDLACVPTRSHLGRPRGVAPPWISSARARPRTADARRVRCAASRASPRRSARTPRISSTSSTSSTASPTRLSRVRTRARTLNPSDPRPAATPSARPRDPLHRVDETNVTARLRPLFRVPIRFPSLAFPPSRPPSAAKQAADDLERRLTSAVSGATSTPLGHASSGAELAAPRSRPPALSRRRSPPDRTWKVHCVERGWWSRTMEDAELVQPAGTGFSPRRPDARWSEPRL